jgi:cell division protein FtsB
MKVGSVLIPLIALFVSFTFVARAQDEKSAAETANDLRAQLQEVQAKEAELQARLKQLDEDLKPENIERYFAGVGSTRPEDLRALRRSQLEREKASVQNQLEQLGGRRARLESSILNADAAAYHQSAKGDTSQPEQLMAAQATESPRWLVAVAGFVAVLGVGSLIAVVRRIRKT